jgi:hypothetical protein
MQRIVITEWLEPVAQFERLEGGLLGRKQPGNAPFVFSNVVAVSFEYNQHYKRACCWAVRFGYRRGIETGYRGCVNSEVVDRLFSPVTLMTFECCAVNRGVTHDVACDTDPHSARVFFIIRTMGFTLSGELIVFVGCFAMQGIRNTYINYSSLHLPTLQ